MVSPSLSSFIVFQFSSKVQFSESLACCLESSTFFPDLKNSFPITPLCSVAPKITVKCRFVVIPSPVSVLCDMVSDIRSVGVGVGDCQSKDPFLCFGAKPTQRACTRDLPRDRKRTRECKDRERGRHQKRAVDRREQRSKQNMMMMMMIFQISSLISNGRKKKNILLTNQKNLGA